MMIKKELKIMSRDLMLLKDKLVFVMGEGNFGTKALKYLKAKRAKVLVADINPSCMAKSEVTVQAADRWIRSHRRKRIIFPPETIRPSSQNFHANRRNRMRLPRHPQPHRSKEVT